jgi:hypothetical protein
LKTIELTQGYSTIVDDQDYDELIKYSWHASIKDEGRNKKIRCYAVGTLKIDGIWKHMFLHTFILGGVYPDGMITDHINGDTLDNRRCNLRFCTPLQNAWNSGKRTNPKRTSQYKGVEFNKSGNKWRVRMRVNGKRIQVGSFIDENDAGRCYNEQARLYYGEFARLNVIQ